MEQIQNIRLGTGIVNNGSIVINPVDVYQQIPAAPSLTRQSIMRPLTQILNFTAWGLSTIVIILLVLALYEVMKI
jgi:hypothetical protein